MLLVFIVDSLMKIVITSRRKLFPTFGYDRCARYPNQELQHEQDQRQKHQAGDAG